MNASAPAPDLALLVVSPPHARRDARAALDAALAAAALDRQLDVFFIGDGLLQLARERSPGDALLPGGHRGWAAVPELGAVRLLAEAEDVRRLQAQGIEFAVPVEPLAADALRRRWRRAARAMVV